MKFTFLYAFMLLTISVFSQTVKKYEGINPLPDSVFDEMIVRDITYAITGEATPVSGVKVDVTKPEGSISGSFKPKYGFFGSLMTLELKGGVTDKNFNFLKGFKNVNSTIEFRPSFHYIFYNNSAKYGVNPDATHNKLLVHTKNAIAKETMKSVRDTFQVIEAIRKYHLSPIFDLKNAGDKSVKPNRNDEYKSGVDDVEVTRLIAIYFIKKVLKDDKLNVDKFSSLEDIITNVGKVNLPDLIKDGKYVEGYIDEIDVLYKKYAVLNKKSIDALMEKQILNASEIWTQKSYFWLTASPFVRVDKINGYHIKFQDKDSLYFKSTNGFNFGGSLYGNWYIINPKKVAYFIRGALSLSRSNNVATLSSFNYETLTPLYKNGIATTQKTESGSAYKYDEIKEGFLKSLTVEFYRLPLKSSFPGFYFSTNLNQSKLYNLSDVKNREGDNLLIGAEGGLVFNVNNKEKDKSILSILAYIRHEDLTDSKRTSLKTGIEETNNDLLKRNIKIGIKVGIPISLPQQ